MSTEAPPQRWEQIWNEVREEAKKAREAREEDKKAREDDRKTLIDLVSYVHATNSLVQSVADHVHLLAGRANRAEVKLDGLSGSVEALRGSVGTLSDRMRTNKAVHEDIEKRVGDVQKLIGQYGKDVGWLRKEVGTISKGLEDTEKTIRDKVWVGSGTDRRSVTSTSSGGTSTSGGTFGGRHSG